MLISKRKELARVNGKGLYLPIDPIVANTFVFWLINAMHSYEPKTKEKS